MNLEKELKRIGARKAPMPNSFKPMLATLVDQVPTGKEWIYEIKWDGYRSLAFCNKNHVDLISRNGKYFNDKYYPILTELKKLCLEAVLDGEIVVIKESGVANFEDLQNWRSEVDGELVYYVFDLLWLNGYSLMEIPLLKRRELLEKLLPSEGSILISKTFAGTAGEFLQAVEKLGLEGIIAKRADSRYYPGQRRADWLKIKALRRHEVVIGGYTINEDTPKAFSALLVGLFDKGRFHYIGKVGTGFNTNEQKEMMRRFRVLETNHCPFAMEPDVNKPSRFRANPPHAKVIWLKPKLVCEVGYTELTSDGIMRHPSFKGMREDKEASEVQVEEPQKLPKTAELKANLTPVKKGRRKTLLNPTEDTQVKTINGHSLKFNNLKKVFFPKEAIAKGDLINYYYQVAPYIIPYLKDRPQSLNRFPNGITGVSFYQKDITKYASPWMEQLPYHTSDGKDKNYLVLKNEEDLLWMANLGAIEMNPWSSRIQHPDNPDWCSIDIDPSDHNTFEQVIEVAQATGQVLDHLKIKGYCKTSGSTGLHIYIPMAARYTYEQSQYFARVIAMQVNRMLPEITSIERMSVKRGKKIYIDFLQNRPTATLAAPYSVRPNEFAGVSMPLHWSEVKKGLRPEQFTLLTAINRILTEGDLFKPVLGRGINMEKALKALEKIT